MRIFISVGTQLPFHRLIKHFDDLSSESKEVEIIAQIGRDDFTYKNIDSYNTLSPRLFSTYLDECDVFITHAGMGNIISALKANKPFLVVPRDHRICEHRNSHQFDTAVWLEREDLAKVCWELSQINISFLKELYSSPKKRLIENEGLTNLINYLDMEIQNA